MPGCPRRPRRRVAPLDSLGPLRRGQEDRRDRRAHLQRRAGRPAAKASFRFRSPAAFKSCPSKPGRKVKKGQLIAELDPDRLRTSAAARRRANAVPGASPGQQRRRELSARAPTVRNAQHVAARPRLRPHQRATPLAPRSVAAQETVQRLKRQLEPTPAWKPRPRARSTTSWPKSTRSSRPGKPIVVAAGGRRARSLGRRPGGIRSLLIRIGDTGDGHGRRRQSRSRGRHSRDRRSRKAGLGRVPGDRQAWTSDPKNARPGMVAEVMLDPKKDAAQTKPGGLQGAADRDRRGPRRSLRLSWSRANRAEGKVVRTPVETGRADRQRHLRDGRDRRVKGSGWSPPA